MPVKTTTKQAKLLQIMADNLKTKGKTKTKKQMLIEAGYSATSATIPAKTLNTEAIQHGQKQLLQQFEQARDLALQESQKKIKSASYQHLIQGADTMQKNINLLTGHATENKAIKIEISQEIAEKNKLITTEANELIPNIALAGALDSVADEVKE